MAGSKDIEILVEKYFDTVNPNLSFLSLLEIVGEVMSKPLFEGKGKAGKKMTITLPIIRLSEKRSFNKVTRRSDFQRGFFIGQAYVY